MNYPEEVQEKKYLLRTIVRDGHKWMARKVQDEGVRLVNIEPLTCDWLLMHFPTGFRAHGSVFDPQKVMNEYWPNIILLKSFPENEF